MDPERSSRQHPGGAGRKGGISNAADRPVPAGMHAGAGLGIEDVPGAVLLLFALAFAGFMALMGLAVNWLLPRRAAVNGVVVAQRSAAAKLSTSGGVIGALACGGAVWALTGVVGEMPALAGCAAVLLLACLLLRRWLHTRGAERFMDLS